MDTTALILAYWTFASLAVFLILRVDYQTFKDHPLVSIGLLTYLGPFGWYLMMTHTTHLIKDKLKPSLTE